MTLLDEIIDEGWFILNRERDGLPCSIHRARLRLMCHELAASEPLNAAPAPQPKKTPPDWQMLAAHDDTFES